MCTRCAKEKKKKYKRNLMRIMNGRHGRRYNPCGAVAPKSNSIVNSPTRQTFSLLQMKIRVHSVHKMLSTNAPEDGKPYGSNDKSNLAKKKRTVSRACHSFQFLPFRLRLCLYKMHLPMAKHGLPVILLLNIWVIANNRSPTNKQAT